MPTLQKKIESIINSEEKIPASHVGFDRDTGVITRLLKRVRGSNRLPRRVQNLES